MSTLVRDDAPTLRLTAADDAEPTRARTPGLLTLLFELSLAVALPPAATIPRADWRPLRWHRWGRPGRSSPTDEPAPA